MKCRDAIHHVSLHPLFTDPGRIRQHHAGSKPTPDAVAEIGGDIALFNIKISATPFRLQQKRPDKTLMLITKGIFPPYDLGIARERDDLPVRGKQFPYIDVIEGVEGL